MEIIHYGHITEEGKLRLSNKESFLKNLALLKNKNVMIIVTDSEKRSLNQLRYYWGIVLKMISDVTGYSVNELHETFKYMFFGAEQKEVFGIKFTSIQSLSVIDKTTMKKYLDYVIDYAKTKLNIEIPYMES